MERLEQFKKQLEGLELEPEMEEIGEVIELRDGVVRASGLRNAEIFEVVEFSEKKIFGLVLNLEEFEVGIAVLGDWSQIKGGDEIKRIKKTLSIPVGPELLGRVIDPLGRPLDGKGEITSKKTLPLERIGPSVIEREPVNFPIHTGILAIDALIPIGRGQRELILGDRGIGKTALTIDTIINQKGEEKRPFCVYVACGQKKSKVKRLINTLEKAGAMEYTTVVCAFSDDPSSFLFLAPYAGCALGEYFRDNSQDALVIFDDLTKQAWAWREISLVLKRPPGREAYPGDIFYIHSKLLERAAKLSKEKGGGSLTTLLIIETKAVDISAYIPTNVISITDGQIFLNTSMFSKGQRPAIDIGKSVSRVGSKAQLPAMKKIAGTLKLDLAQFQELERFSEFTEELDPETKKIIEKGKRIRELLKQDDLNPLPLVKEVTLIYAGVKGYLDDLPLEKIRDFKKALAEEVEREKKDFNIESENKIVEIIKRVKAHFSHN